MLLNTAIVIPALNEERTIAEVLQGALALRTAEVIVVDDGSEDKTASIAREMGATVLTHVSPRSAWIAMQTGMLYASKKGYKAVLTMDADGQHSAAAALEVLQVGNEIPGLIVGSCTSRGSTLRHVAWWLFRRVTRLQVADVTSGLRLYRGKALHAATSRQASMLEFQDVGVLMLITQLGVPIHEVEVAMHDRQGDKSRIFSSWGRVTYYMATTLLLCVAKGLPQKRTKLEKRLTHVD